MSGYNSQEVYILHSGHGFVPIVTKLFRRSWSYRKELCWKSSDGPLIQCNTYMLAFLQKQKAIFFVWLVWNCVFDRVVFERPTFHIYISDIQSMYRWTYSDNAVYNIIYAYRMCRSPQGQKLHCCNCGVPQGAVHIHTYIPSPGRCSGNLHKDIGDAGKVTSLFCLPRDKPRRYLGPSELSHKRRHIYI